MVHTVPGARLPVPRRQLPAALLQEDEEDHGAHQELRVQDERGLFHLQAARCPVLLPRQGLQGARVPRPLLPQHQAEDAAAAGAAAALGGRHDAQEDRQDEHHDGAEHGPHGYGLLQQHSLKNMFGAEVQASPKRWCPGCENAPGKFRLKW